MLANLDDAHHDLAEGPPEPTTAQLLAELPALRAEVRALDHQRN